MSTTRNRPASLSQRRLQWIKYHIELVTAVPEPGERWEIHDTEFSSPEITRLQSYGIIQKQGYIDDTTREACWWRTDPQAYEYAHDYLNRISKTPCGHTGVRTLEAGETYTCCYDACNETFGRDAAEAVIR